jgi:GT2 family glycosyltransferase
MMPSVRYLTAVPPRISVIVPARNAAATLAACLDAIRSQLPSDGELIVIDDGSTDATVEIAAQHGALVRTQPKRLGVAAARNRGAALARAPLLFFLDADVVPAPGAMERGLDAMADPSIDAIVGSYDDQPHDQSTVSRFKNLAHHYFHQQSPGPTQTFWGACSLIRREMFLGAGGFDERRWSIEDIALGYWLAQHGARVRLDPHLRVKHLKRWTLWSLIATDITVRAIPWTLLALSGGGLPRNLNFGTRQRIAALIALALVCLIPVALVRTDARLAVAALLAASVAINRGLFVLFLRHGGVQLAVGGFLLQQLYYLYSICGALVAIALRLKLGPALLEAPWRSRLN